MNLCNSLSCVFSVGVGGKTKMLGGVGKSQIDGLISTANPPSPLIL